MKINPIHRIKGQLTVPGDKSISHRAVMLGSLSKGKTTIHNFLQGADCLSTIQCFKQLGIDIHIDDQVVHIHGKGLYGLKKPSKTLNVGNSGTTMRLISGILCGQPFETQLDGDNSIRSRPMDRILMPLSQMGAEIKSLNQNNKAPLSIIGTSLHSIKYQLPVASAQVKSCILLAGLYAEGITKVLEPVPTRNHTEIMLKQFGCHVENENKEWLLHPCEQLYGTTIHVPADISSAAYFIVAGLILPDSEVVIKNVGINPTRDGIIEILKKMNASIELHEVKEVNGELTADIYVRSSRLIGTEISGTVIPRLIDEIPILAVAAALAEGKTIIKDAKELKVKESNRIDTMVKELKKMGAAIEATDDGMVIHGVNQLNGASLESYHDHRVAMALIIAALGADNSSTLSHADCMAISYPDFMNDVNSIAKSSI